MTARPIPHLHTSHVSPPPFADLQDSVGVSAKPFGAHTNTAAPHKGRTGADRESDEQWEVVDQRTVSGQARASGGEFKGVSCRRGDINEKQYNTYTGPSLQR